MSLSTELTRRLFYVSSDIVGFELVARGEQVEAVDITTARPLDAQVLGDKINALVEAELLGQRPIEARVVWRSSRSRERYHDGMYETLLSSGLAFEAGPGQVGLAGPLMALMDYLDTRIRAIAMDSFRAEEYRYPRMLQSKVLEDLDYFGSFPQLVMFVTHLHNDIDVYRAFVADVTESKRLTPKVFSYCQSHEFCLPPTMCYHTFSQFRGSALGANRVVTARGGSFRYESKYHRGLERLWDFTIREIVFLGDRDFVVECRQGFMQAAQALIDELGLSGHCEVANDPFFVGQDTVARTFSQQMMELKYELRLDIALGETVAAASFNFHDGFFGDRFEIKGAGEQNVRTACVGFGLERFTYAFCCQHGHDPAGWPAAVREAMGGSA